MAVAGPALEALWRRAATDTLAAGRIVDPPLDELRRLAAHAWEGIDPWPAEAMQDRIGRLMDSHRLAIAVDDDGLLGDLGRAWASAPPAAELWPQRAAAEISGRWDEDVVELLVEDGLLDPASPADRAWLALGRGDVAAARAAIAELPPARVDNALVHPGVVLEVERRALAALSRRP